MEGAELPGGAALGEPSEHCLRAIMPVVAGVAARTGSGEVLALVRRALDEFDDVTVDVSVRRAIRIANLLGDTFTAVRLALELRPGGGHPPANAEMTKRLMLNPNEWGERGGVAERAVDAYIAEHTIGPDKVEAHSITELAFWISEHPPRDEIPASRYGEFLESHERMTALYERARHHAFTLLCQWERQLTFAAVQDDALESVRELVDSTLDTTAPEVLAQFNAAFRRLREAATREAAEADEELAQAVTSCRRILKAVVDVVQPARQDRLVSDDGHSLGDGDYRNRLVEFLHSRAGSKSFSSALADEGESLWKRFVAIDTFTNKGVHAHTAAVEADFCALHTYLIAGEILRLAPAGEITGDPDPDSTT